MAVLCVTNSSAEILLHVFRHRFFAEHHILALFCQNAVAIKSIKDYLCKSCSALTPNYVDEVDL
jgi:hypothetical protein